LLLSFSNRWDPDAIQALLIFILMLKKTFALAGLIVLLMTATRLSAQQYTLDKKIPLPGDGGYDYLSIDEVNNHLFVSHGTSVNVVDLATEKPAFAEALQLTLKALQEGLNDPPFNYFIHSAPFKADAADAYHWHLELIPKLSTAAGFELGTGMWINVVKPEESAAFLRDRINKTVGQPA